MDTHTRTHTHEPTEKNATEPTCDLLPHHLALSFNVRACFHVRVFITRTQTKFSRTHTNTHTIMMLFVFLNARARVPVFVSVWVCSFECVHFYFRKSVAAAAAAGAAHRPHAVTQIRCIIQTPLLHYNPFSLESHHHPRSIRGSSQPEMNVNGKNQLHPMWLFVLHIILLNTREAKLIMHGRPSDGRAAAFVVQSRSAFNWIDAGACDGSENVPWYLGRMLNLFTYYLGVSRRKMV